MKQRIIAQMTIHWSLNWFRTEPLNVGENIGVAGDGVTDDTTAIQYIIDMSPRSTIFFPCLVILTLWVNYYNTSNR